MTDRILVDTASLTTGGINLGQWSRLADQIALRIRTATVTYRYAGGTGEMGEKFDTNYRPGAEKALQFLVMLQEVVGGHSERTLLVARKFDQTNDDADASTPQG